MYSFFSPLSSSISRRPILARAHEAGSLPVFFLCSFRLALFPSLSLSLYHRAFLFRLFLLSFFSFVLLMGGVKLRNELSRNDAFFSARYHEKKREIHQNSIYLLYFFSNRDPVKMVSPFRLFGLFFSFFVSLFRLLTSASTRNYNFLKHATQNVAL